MRQQIIKNKFYYNIQAIFVIFILALVVSFLYVFITGKYNGDFSSYEISINRIILLPIFLLSFLPYWFIWRKYKLYKKKQIRFVSSINVEFLKRITISLLLFRILLLIIGVGALGQTTTLGWLKTISTILNPSLVACIYIVSSTKKRNVCIVVSLILLESVLRHSLGGVFILLLMLLLKYFQELLAYCKKHYIIAIVILLLIPNIVAIGYNFRTYLRHGNNFELRKDKSAISLLCGALAGRLSSYSNTVFIVENAPYFYAHMSVVPSIFYQSLILNQFGIHLVSWGETSTLEQFMFEVSRDGNRPEGDTTTFMVGTVGMLVLSFMKSPSVFFLNLITMVLIIEIWFKLTMFLRIDFSPELALLFLLFPIVSGVATELFFPIFQIIILYFFFYIYRKFSVK